MLKIYTPIKILINNYWGCSGQLEVFLIISLHSLSALQHNYI